MLVAEGDTVTVGQVIARIAVGAVQQVAATPATAPPAPREQPAGASGAVPDGVNVSPVAARAAAVEGVDLAQVSGSGPTGRITKSDVLAAAAGNGAAATDERRNAARTPARS